jgi:RimJ/RimL family protein N-acetyltransferase
MSIIATRLRSIRDRITVGRNRWVTIRPIEATDADGLLAFYAALSPEARYSRFLGASRGIDHRTARRFAAANHQTRDGLVAELGESGPNDGAIVGHACLEPDGPDAEEIAFAVADELQGNGIGTALMAGAIESAKRRGIRRLNGLTFVTNTPMQRLAVHLGNPIKRRGQGSGVIRFEVDLTKRADRMPSGPGHRSRTLSPPGRLHGHAASLR